MNELAGAQATRAAPDAAARLLTRLAKKRTAWTVSVATALVVAATVTFAVLSRAAPRPAWHPWWLIVADSMFGVLLPSLGTLVASRRPSNPAGWLLLAAGFGAAFDSLVHAYALYAVPRGLPGGVLAAWSGNWSFVLFTFPIMFLFLIFPNGRLPTPCWRVTAKYVGACGLLNVIVGALLPGTLGNGYFPSITNPLGLPALEPVVPRLGLISIVTNLLPLLLSVASLLFRYRHSTGLVRRQLKWVAWATMVAILLVTVQIMVGDRPLGSIAIGLVPVLLSAAITVGIVRHNLFDIDRLLSNTLIYAALTGLAVGLYIGTVSAFGLLLQRSSSGLAALFATGVVAVLLQPLHTLLHRSVSRLVYGLRDDPYTALAVLGRRLEATHDPKRILPEAAAAVAEALRLPYVSIELVTSSSAGRNHTRVATRGTEPHELIELALVHQGEEIGSLIVGPRSPGEHFSKADTRLLRDAARHIAQAASAVRLSLTLLAAQERAVAVAAEERRRLARDLHDGVGPVLTGATWTLQAALTTLHRDPDAAHELLATALVHLRQGTEDLRLIATGLRSPADQLGLREAVLTHLGRVPLTMHTALPDDIPRLPAAVEEAAYWILAEAVANILRHADADNCWVTMDLDDTLSLTVADDGSGLPDRFRPGVGIASMRERAGEIGGTCDIRPRPRAGTEVVVCLPRALPGAGTGRQAVKGGIT
ncbi:sensor histidine kinase [Streptomyces spectabilis]|uniref:Sensor histidine kinase n=1 Tax=Streptomyces spectabilis TaxID=68270 RepID=A0A5P2XMD6_STRST|nr:sensor histidine kinase [Streptomyces spectabilis]MBB5102373.1 signal transduction histidine kinase [Streptomyces spectabilis]MCI3907418.1 histidine kinase [Streptomyces spectabilis]QEV64130.1 sensor histidine kinase [Streptomyces spectabilis]GGV30393.1 hypothetical protein GCM10010245_49470 [Streptomyces spectabilis]